MIRLKKKEAPVVTVADSTAVISQPSSASTSIESNDEQDKNKDVTLNNDNNSVNNNDNGVNLFGIAGKKVKQDGDNKKRTKKRTPGEIRIQKGLTYLSIHHI